MRAALVLLLLATAAPIAGAVALLESGPGRAVVQVDGNATIHGDGEVRFAPPGATLGPWLPAQGLALGAGGCERGLCGLVVVEVRGAEAVVVEATSGVLIAPAPEAGATEAAVAPASAPFVPVPQAQRPAPAGLLVALAAVALAAVRR